MAVAGNAKHRLTSEEVETKITSLLPETEYFMLGGAFKLNMLLPVLEQIVTMAKTSETKIVVDHGRLVNVTTGEIELVKGLVLQSDYYLPSRDEFQKVWSVGSIEKGLRKLADQSSVLTVVKDGPKGAVTLIDGEIIRVPAFSVEVTNTIGAGDSFNAGFIVALKEGMSLSESIQFACATAALKISRSELPTRQGVKDFMQSTASG